MTPSPADEARRALRAARERGETARPADAGTDAGIAADADADGTDREAAPERGRTPAPPQDACSAGPEERNRGASRSHGEYAGPRPGDVARAALRSARAVADPADPGDDPASPDTASVSVSVPKADGRPADVVREALRAARRQAREGAEAERAAGGRRAAHPARRAPGTGGSPAEARARVVRDFIADAFRLPPEADLPDEAPPPGTTAGTPRSVVPSPTEPDPSSGAAPDPSSGAAPDPDPTSAPSRTEHTAQPAEAPAPTGEPSLPPSWSSHGPPPPRQAVVPPEGDPAVRGRTAYPVAYGQDRSTPPAAPRTPRSMAAPNRDGDLRRTFPALPPGTAPDGGFAETWWGNAWVTALEEGALDAERLGRGRGYAEQGHVDAITVTPGLALAYVQGSRPRPYRVQVRLRTLDDADWERFLDAAAERPGHIAALLDGELPHTLADCGVPLLPGPGDLVPRCSCPDSGHPCKHAAALCYQTARLLDADPFVLLLLRGRGERELLDALSRLSAARAARAAQDKGPEPLPGVRATEALAVRALPPLPAPLPAPPHPEQPPAYPAAPGGPDPFALDQLATDAAARAHALLTTGRDPVGGLTLWQDAVRHAAARPGSGLTAGTRALYSSLARAAGRSTSELARAVAAWRQGGLEALTVLEEPWDPPAGRFDRARPLLLAADLPAFRPWRNHLTHPAGHLQLRLGRTGLWYAYESEPGRDDWWPRGTPDLDPVGALTGLAGAGGL
ncbi:SWIM zinc finger family protein [Streptomyces sp. JHA26]|uniref:SWIM zinc finger family protein n=1 Tax=Streptomyces sp. JHA26 TaxID=1917143 RepID=UPI00098A9B92|nr:SWIM zinc finger family protein [Streptomyces sp. JHA26]